MERNNLAVQGAGAEVPALAPDLGPLVRRTWGDSVEIFEGRRMGMAGMAVLFGVTAGAASALRELVWRGPWSALLFFALAGALTLTASWRRWRRRRWFARTPSMEQMGTAASGALVRVAGTIELSGHRFTAPGTDRSVVWARSLFWESGYRGRPSSTAREEVRGVPFRIRLDGGGSVRVQAKDLTLAEEPRQVRGVASEVLDALGAARRGGVLRKAPRFLQATLAEGERIEAVGYLSTEVSVHGEGAPARGTPLVHTLVPAGTGAVWVRRVG